MPWVTLPSTSLLTPSAFPEPANESASSRFFGAALAMAWLTAAMKPALSKPFGLAVAIVSTWAALACPALSSDGGIAASRALPVSAEPEGCRLRSVAAAPIAPVVPANRGSACGSAGAGAAGAGGQAVPASASR